MRVIAAAALVLFATVQSAQALTIRDVIELTRAGITDEVLVALIEVDGGVYATDPATLKSLKSAGVSERVMIALIRSGRQRPVDSPVPAPVVEDSQAQTPPPPTVIIEHHEPQVEQVAVPYPIYVPVYTNPDHARRRIDDGVDFRSSNYVPFQPAAPVGPRPQPAAQPVYWGFGGKLRPDAWGQPQDRNDRSPDDGGRGDKPAKK